MLRLIMMTVTKTLVMMLSKDEGRNVIAIAGGRVRNTLATGSFLHKLKAGWWLITQKVDKYCTTDILNLT